MPRKRRDQAAPGQAPPCLAYGPWLTTVAGEQHRHVCMQNEGHDGPHRCAWHPQDKFEAEGRLPRELLP